VNIFFAPPKSGDKKKGSGGGGGGAGGGGGGGGGGGSGAITDYMLISRAATYAETAGVLFAVSFDTETSDASGYFNPAAPTRVTVPTGKAGWHFWTWYWAQPVGSGDRRSMTQFIVYNSSDVQQRYYIGPMGKDLGGNEFSILTKLNDGDYFTTNVFPDSTTNLTAARLELMRLG
jgi:hypothetical protein